MRTECSPTGSISAYRSCVLIACCMQVLLIAVIGCTLPESPVWQDEIKRNTAREYAQIGGQEEGHRYTAVGSCKSVK